MGNTCCCKGEEEGILSNMAEKKSQEEINKMMLELASKHEPKIIKIQARARGILARK